MRIFRIVSFASLLFLGISETLCSQCARAGLRISAETPVLLGEWHPSETSERFGNFLLVDVFTPGKRLAVKLFVEDPGETVEIKFMIEAVSEPPYYLKKIIRDNGPQDLLSVEEAVILAELGSVPDYAVSRYIVEVRDDTGRQPVTREWRIPLESEGFLEYFGAALAEQANMLWNLPETIASSIMKTTRGVYQGKKLVIASHTGQIINEVSPTEAGYIETPLWLSDNQILFVERQWSGAHLKVIDAMFRDEPQEFGASPIVGEDPHLLSQRKALVFRQGSQLMIADVPGTKILSLVPKKEVIHILGIFPEKNKKRDNLLFLARNPELDILDLWLAKIEGTTLCSLQQLPYDERWKRLADIHVYQEQILYEQIDYRHGQSIMNIYLKPSSTAKPRKITFDRADDRYPAWSPDGNRIVYVSADRP